MTAVPLAGTGAARDTARPPRRHRRLTPWLFIAPYGLLFVAFIALPAFYGIWVSLHDWDFLAPNKPWVGLDNYTALFTPGSRDYADFWSSMGATAIFTVITVPVMVVLPLPVAMLMNARFPGQTFFRAVVFLPYVLGIAVVGVLWRFLLDPNVGLVNYYLGLVGIKGPAWTTALPWAWISLVVMTAWWTIGLNSVIYLAGLQDIDPALYEAAALDGASRWDQFWNVTLPGLRGVVGFIVTITFLSAANMFGQSYVLTQGAPGTSTRTVIMLIANTGLRSFRMGSAAAMSYLFMVILVATSLVATAIQRRAAR